MSHFFYQSKLLDSLPHILHGFTSRHGGTSAAPFAELNLSTRVGDDLQNVRANRQKVLDTLQRPDATFVCLKQVHEATLLELTHTAAKNIEADGLYTRDTKAVLATLVADCVPILMADIKNRVVAAVHAGWRGTQQKIAQKMVSRLEDLKILPSELRIAIGPAIGPCCFGIGDDVYEQLRTGYPEIQQAFSKTDAGQQTADLWLLNQEGLVHAGVAKEHIEVLRYCTSCHKDFFSHRRDQGTTGRQAGVIAFRQ